MAQPGWDFESEKRKLARINRVLNSDADTCGPGIVSPVILQIHWIARR